MMKNTKSLSRNLLTALVCTSMLMACSSSQYDEPESPTAWMSSKEKAALYEEFKDVGDVKTLESWWTFFNDPALDRLISSAMALNPDRAMALAKIKEARGIERSTRSTLFPQIGAGANASRQDAGEIAPDSYYDAAFDASFEVDIFGKNRNAAAAADLQAEQAEAAFESVTLSMIAEVARVYVEYRYFEKQLAIATRNLESEEKTLGLIRKQYEIGEAPQLDVERGENQVNATRATIPDYKRQSEQARLRLSVLTGLMPEYVVEIVKDAAPIPGAGVAPVLASPAQVLSARPDIRAARLAFAASTKTAASETAALFPNLTLSGLFGIQDSAFVSSASVWSVALGVAVSLVDFGRIEGRIDAAKAREEQAYHALRKTVLEAVMDVEQSMVAYAHINEQRVSLEASLGNARKALELSQQLYKEGEVSFLDVLDAQRSVNAADAAAVRAEFEQSVALIALYKSLGVY